MIIYLLCFLIALSIINFIILLSLCNFVINITDFISKSTINKKSNIIIKPKEDSGLIDL